VVLFEGLLPECCGLVASGSAFLSDLYKLKIKSSSSRSSDGNTANPTAE